MALAPWVLPGTMKRYRKGKNIEAEGKCFDRKVVVVSEISR